MLVIFNSQDTHVMARHEGMLQVTGSRRQHLARHASRPARSEPRLARKWSSVSLVICNLLPRWRWGGRYAMRC